MLTNYNLMIESNSIPTNPLRSHPIHFWWVEAQQLTLNEFCEAISYWLNERDEADALLDGLIQQLKR